LKWEHFVGPNAQQFERGPYLTYLRPEVQRDVLTLHCSSHAVVDDKRMQGDIQRSG
jgi:hypothetical protein